MKKTLKLMLCAVLVLLTVSLFATAALADQEAENLEQIALPQRIRVKLNGSYVSFTDAEPRLTNDRTFIPFRAVFNALGFDDSRIGWDDATETASAWNDSVTLSLTIGQTVCTVTADGQEKIVEMDVAPYLYQDRTYVPVRFVAEALGCSVGWDDAAGVVIIDDVAAILAANPASYALIDRLMAESAENALENALVSGTAALALKQISEANTVEAKVNAEVTELSDAAAMDLDFAADLTGTVTDAAGTKTLAEAFGVPEKLNLSLRCNAETGDLALCADELMGALMGAATGSSVPMKNTWFTLNTNDLLGTLGVAQDDLMGQVNEAKAMTGFSEAVAFVLDQNPLTDSDMTTAEMLAMLNGMFSDDAFVRDGNDYVSTFALPGLEDLTMKFTVCTDGTKPVKTVVSFTCDVEGYKATGVIASTFRTVNMDVSVEGAALSLSLTADVTMTEAEQKPTGAVPEGVIAIDAMALLGTFGF